MVAVLLLILQSGILGVVLSQWAGSHLKAAVKELLSLSQQFCSQIWGAEKQLGQQSCWIGKTNMCMVKTLTWCATLLTVSCIPWLSFKSVKLTLNDLMHA
jgi:hypothetical protein